MSRDVFDSMRPKEVSREQLKTLLRGGNIGVFELFLSVGFVTSKSDFRRQVKERALSIEDGHLTFKKVTDEFMTVTVNDFIEDKLLLMKGKTTVDCVAL